MSGHLLEIENLEAGYGAIQVLRSISVHLDAGERIGLFGPNGHGKTTLLRAISGLLKPWRGNIRFLGADIGGRSPVDIVDRGIIHVSQGNILFPRMTVLENLTLGAYSRRAWPQRKHNLEKVFDLFPRLAERRQQMCRTLSGGERQMVALGMGLMGEGRLLMLDEPTLGLAPKLKEELMEAIAQIARSGMPLVLVEQDVEFLLALTDRLYFVEKGAIVFSQEKGDARLEHDQILQMYFGGSDRQAVASLREEKL